MKVNPGRYRGLQACEVPWTAHARITSQNLEVWMVLGSKPELRKALGHLEHGTLGTVTL